MTVWNRDELLALDAETLRGLLDVAEGDNVMERAAYLGLEPFHSPADYEAIVAAVPELKTGTQPFSPPVGAAQPGVRSDLTPTVRPAPGLPDRVAEDLQHVSDEMGLPEPGPEAAADLASMLARSAATGEPVVAGTFALYAHPSGAIILTTETTTHGVRQDVIPKRGVKLALSMIAGKGAGIFGRLFGG
jgi:hypothetical protein